MQLGQGGKLDDVFEQMVVGEELAEADGTVQAHPIGSVGLRRSASTSSTRLPPCASTAARSRSARSCLRRRLNW